ncbi:MAG: hypothetical protein RMM06_09890, partial [Armatimonadota bacterium]|nr:hypothetical protein [Armatimonadota bacterium]
LLPSRRFSTVATERDPPEVVWRDALCRIRRRKTERDPPTALEGEAPAEPSAPLIVPPQAGNSSPLSHLPVNKEKEAPLRSREGQG